MILMMGSDGGVSAFPEGDNIFQWTGTIDGGRTRYARRLRRRSSRRARPPRRRAGRARLAHPPRARPLLDRAHPRPQVYEDMQFKLAFKFPTSYPYEAPQVTFVTPCFHPNVDQYGNICLDIPRAPPPPEPPPGAPEPPLLPPPAPRHPPAAAAARRRNGRPRTTCAPSSSHPEPAGRPEPRQPTERPRRDLAQDRRVQGRAPEAQEPAGARQEGAAARGRPRAAAPPSSALPIMSCVLPTCVPTSRPPSRRGGVPHHPPSAHLCADLGL